jgi:glycosyltransferase involved in cell wall biosynthesis
VADVPRILTTAHDQDWPRTDRIRAAEGSRRLWRIREIAARARFYDIVLLNGAVSAAHLYDEILAAGLAARLAPEVCIVLEGCYWEAGTRVLERALSPRRPRGVGFDPPATRGRWLSHALVTWVNRPSVHYIVFGSDERHTFGVRWSIPEERVVSMTYHGDAWPEETVVGPAENRGYVFAGGDSLRDYRPLLGAAGRIAAPIVIATTLPMPPLPPNVQAGALTEPEFRAASARAAVHVVPMIADPPRSAGQASYLDALMLGIPVVVTDGLGVRDHIRDGHDGLIVPAGDAAALAGAINACLTDAELRRRLSTTGRARAASEFTLERFRAREYQLMLGVWRRHRQ